MNSLDFLHRQFILILTKPVERNSIHDDEDEMQRKFRSECTFIYHCLQFLIHCFGQMSKCIEIGSVAAVFFLQTSSINFQLEFEQVKFA